MPKIQARGPNMSRLWPFMPEEVNLSQIRQLQIGFPADRFVSRKSRALTGAKVSVARTPANLAQRDENKAAFIVPPRGRFKRGGNLLHGWRCPREKASRTGCKEPTQTTSGKALMANKKTHPGR